LHHWHFVKEDSSNHEGRRIKKKLQIKNLRSCFIFVTVDLQQQRRTLSS